VNTAQRHAACVVWWIAAAVVAGPARGDDRPDIVWIVADDLGHAELSVHGSSHVKTPHIDSIAEQGVRFTQAYAAAPVCCPSRAGLLTGRYPQRMGLGANPGPALLTPPDFGLPDDEVTAAEQLRDLGYTTALVGKWHLGYAPKKHPGHHGFDRFFGFLGGLNGYFPGRRPLDEPIFRDDRRVIEPEYLTDAFGREAVAAIDGAGDQPLFLMLSFNAVHGPLQATEEDLRRFAGVPGKRRRAYVAMTASLDDAVGDVLEALQRRNRDALIVFMSDNGGPTRETTASNEPFEGHKYQLLEGGVRVPMFAQWTGRLEPGVTFDEPVIALDLLPTAVVAAGGGIADDLDGVDLLPFLDGRRTGAPHEHLYWRYAGQWAIRSGDHKLVKQCGHGKPRLFDLSSDEGERRDVAEERSDVVEELRSVWEAWAESL